MCHHLRMFLFKVIDIYYQLIFIFVFKSTILIFVNCISSEFLIHIFTLFHAYPICFCSFLYIMPTLLKIYSNYQSNLLLCEVIEFTCRQFYTLHRKPFLLQMFGSIAQYLNEDKTVVDYAKVCFDYGLLFIIDSFGFYLCIVIIVNFIYLLVR